MPWRLSLFVVGLLTGMAFGAAPSMVLTARENGTTPDAEFNCSGMIHGYVRLPTQELGRHVLESIWTRPDRQVAADSRDELNFAPPGRSTAYVWFAFPEPRSLLGALDVKQEQERLSYPGTWSVQIKWDERPLLTLPFQVRCR